MKPAVLNRYAILLFATGCVGCVLPLDAQDLGAIVATESAAETPVEKPASKDVDADADSGLEQIPSDPIDLDDLASPPDDIVALIKRGNVRLCTGRISWSETRQARERTGIAGSGFRLAAETKAEFRYDYRSRTKWRKRYEGDKAILLVTVRFNSSELKLTHLIWFRRPPPADTFWEDRIVQHEFDHVRLSTHPMIEKIFREKIADLSRFRYELKDGETVDGKLVNRLVQERVKAATEEISSLINIRYKELDRVSRHGLDKVPEDSDVVGWLQHES